MAKNKSRNPDPFAFFKQSDFDYEQVMAREFHTVDNKFTVTIFRINSVATQSTGNRHQIAESRSREKNFHAPVEFAAQIEAGAATFKYIGGSGIQKQEYESFSCNIFLADMETKNVVIHSGDFLLFNDGDKDRFFEITTITTVNTGNGRGFKPVFAHIAAVLKGDASIPDSLKKR